MAESIRITTPFTEEMSRKLKAGDSVLITGTIISARDAAHKEHLHAAKSCLSIGTIKLSIILVLHLLNLAIQSVLVVLQRQAEWTLTRRQC